MIKNITLAVVLCVAPVAAFSATQLQMKPCIPEDLSHITTDKQLKAELESQARKVCDAEDAVFPFWQQRIDMLDDDMRSLEKLTRDKDWDGYKKKWAETLVVLNEFRSFAKQHRDVNYAPELLSFFEQDISYVFQNAGFSPTFDLDDVTPKLEAGLNNDKDNNMPYVGIRIVQQSIQRGGNFIRGFALKEKADAIKNQMPASRKSFNDATIRALQKSDSEILCEADPSRCEHNDAKKIHVDMSLSARIKEAVSSTFTAAIFLTIFAYIFALKTGRNSIRAAMKTPFISVAAIAPLRLDDVFFGSVMAGSVKFAFTVALFIFFWKMSEKLPMPWAIVFGGNTPRGLRSGGSSMTTHGSAELGATSGMIAHGHLHKRGEKVAALVLGRAGDVAQDYDNRFRIDSHVITFAPTGSGKGVGAVIPNLLEYPGSAFVLDIKGENYAVTARARREMGHAVYLVDPFGIAGDTAHAFNPLDRLDLNSPDIVGDAASVADMIVITGKDEKGNHWNESAKDLIRGLICYAVSDEDPKRRNLPHVRHLLTCPASEWDETIANMAVSTAAFGVIARAANAFLSKPKDERGSVLSTAQRHTSFLDDPRIAATLSRSDFSFNGLKTGMMTVYLAIPLDKLDTQARFVRAVFGAAQGAVMATQQKPLHKVLFLLDEFGQLGYMPIVETGISLIRGYGGVYWLFFQDLGQLKPVYQKWQSLMANAAKHYYGTADFETAKYISDSIGKTTIEYETSSTSSGQGRSGSIFRGNANTSNNSGTNTTQHIVARDLLTPDEVMKLGADIPIVMISGEPPYLLRRIKYFQDADYAPLADRNPYV